MTKLQTFVNPETLLKEYKERGYNILTDSINLGTLGHRFRATVEIRSLSPKPDDGDVYDYGKGKFIITKQGLDKLAVLAAIKFHIPYGSTRTDDEKNDDYVSFSAIGAIMKANGQHVVSPQNYDMDLKAWEQDSRYKAREKGVKYKKTGKDLEDYIEYVVGKEMRSLRKHKSTRCESGARSRVIRSLLGTKKHYSQKELQNPFVCISISYILDDSDPVVKKLLTLNAIGAQGAIFGSTPALPAPKKAHPEAPEAVYEEADPIDPEDMPEETNGVDTEIDEVISEHEPDPEEDEDFDNWDRESREKYLKDLCKKIPYDLSALFGRMENVSSLADVSDVQLSAMKDKFSKMPIDDIPY